MLFLMKIKVNLNVNDQFGHNLIMTDLDYYTKGTVLRYVSQASKLFFTFALLKGQSVKGQYHIVSYDNLLCKL